jgi:raffinose/stachyose/melibiose transport system permease protein
MGLYRYTARSFARELSLLAIAVIWWIPFYFLVTIALKPTRDVLQSPMQFPSTLDFGNFSEAWKGSGSSISVSRGLQNSLIITGCTVLALIVLGSMCAYAIARRPGRIGNTLYILFVLGIILPFQLGIVPVYVALRHLHLVGKYAGMILLNTGLLMPLAVFLYTGFVRALPREYEEAAQVDGASLMRTYTRVIFPLLLPVTGTVAILAGLIVWNDFFLSLIFLSGTPNATLPVAVYGFVGEYASQWNLIFAAVIVSLLPILAFFLVAQKQLIKGFTGGIKA